MSVGQSGSGEIISRVERERLRITYTGKLMLTHIHTCFSTLSGHHTSVVYIFQGLLGLQGSLNDFSEIQKIQLYIFSLLIFTKYNYRVCCV